VKFKYLFISFIILLSCSSLKKIGIDILIPSEVTFNNQVKKVIVLNNSTYPRADSLLSDSPEPLSENELFIIDTIVIRKTFEGLFSILDDSPLLFLQNAEYLEIRNTGEEYPPDPLSESAIINLCEETGSDMIISFEYYDFIINYNKEFSFDSEIYAYLNFNRRFIWRIYKNDGSIFNEYFLNDTVYWSSSGSTADEAESGLPDLTNAIRMAFYYAGEQYGQRISPSWQQTSRVYYKFKERGDKAGKTDYSFDKERLIELTDSNKNPTAYKACINLALLSEKEDDIKGAIHWLNQANSKKPSTKLVRVYKKILKERLINKNKIDKQLNYSF